MIEFDKGVIESMGIEIVTKFLNMNSVSTINHIEKDIVIIVATMVDNNMTHYVWGGDNPHVVIFKGIIGDFYTIYRSNLDKLEFKKGLNEIISLDQLDEMITSIYRLEDEIRGDDYTNEKRQKQFISKMLELGWILN